MSFMYGKLRDRIATRYSTMAAFADALGIGRATLSLKLNNQSSFTASEISRACVLLEIPASEIGDYFFCVEC